MLTLKVLLFEPRRLAETDSLFDPRAPELINMIPHPLAVIREIADRSEFVKQLVSACIGSSFIADDIHSISKPYTGSYDAIIQTFSIKLTLTHSEGLWTFCLRYLHFISQWTD